MWTYANTYMWNTVNLGLVKELLELGNLDVLYSDYLFSDSAMKLKYKYKLLILIHSSSTRTV